MHVRNAGKIAYLCNSYLVKYTYVSNSLVKYTYVSNSWIAIENNILQLVSG